MSATTMKATGTRRPLLASALLAVALGAALWFWGGRPLIGAQIVHEPVSQPLGAATRAEVTIAMALGQLRIGALEEPGALVAGDIAYLARNRVVRDFAISGDTATFSLREEDSQAHSLIRYDEKLAVWDLQLAPDTPMHLNLEAGLGESEIDLSGLQVTDLTLQSGIGNTMVTLPARGQVRARVEGGVGNMTIRVPTGVAVRVTMDVGIGAISLPATYWRQGDVAVAPGYGAAANQVELTISSGVGNISIQQLGK